MNDDPRSAAMKKYLDNSAAAPPTGEGPKCTKGDPDFGHALCPVHGDKCPPKQCNWPFSPSSACQDKSECLKANRCLKNLPEPPVAGTTVEEVVNKLHMLSCQDASGSVCPCHVAPGMTKGCECAGNKATIAAILRPFIPSQPPAEKWNPVIAEAFKIDKVNMNCFKLYFFGSFLGAHHSEKSAQNRAELLSTLILKWTNRYTQLLTKELIEASQKLAAPVTLVSQLPTGKCGICGSTDFHSVVCNGCGATNGKSVWFQSPAVSGNGPEPQA